MYLDQLFLTCADLLWILNVKSFQVDWMSVFALLCTDRSTYETVQETEDSTKRVFLLPHGRGESDPTVPMGGLYRVVR